MSLKTTQVTLTGRSSIQNQTPALKRKSNLGSLILTAQGHSTRKTSKDAKGEAVAERSVTAGTLANPKPSTASLDSRKSNDSKKGKLQTAAVAQTTVSSDLGASHTLLSSLPISHSSFSQKNDVLEKGLVASAGDNTLIADVTSLATDPSHLSSNTAPAVNVSLQSQREIQADPSVSNDPSAKTQTDDDEDTKISNHHFLLSSRGSTYITESRGSSEELLMLPEMLIWKTFNQIEIKPEMIGTYLAEYSISYKPVIEKSIQINSSETELLKRPLLRYSSSCYITTFIH